MPVENPLAEVDEVDAVIEGLSSPDSQDVYFATLPYNQHVISAVAARIALEGGGGGAGTSLEGFYDVKASPYNAVGNNSNDDTAEIAAAITACVAAGGGIVYLPPGIYRISSTITIPASVSVWGAGSAQNTTDAASILRCTAAGAGLSFEGDGGLHQNFYIDGNSVANEPLRRWGSYSGASFHNVDVRFAAQDGLSYRYAQNDTWVSCRFQNSGRYSGRFDAGCGGLTFIACDFSNAGTNDVRFHETFGDGGYQYPTDLKFFCCRFEYVNANNPVIYHAQGERISFWNGLVGQRGTSYAGAAFHQIDNAVGSVTLDSMQFTGDAYFAGGSAIHAGVNATQPLTVRGFTYVNAFSYVLDAPSGSRLLLEGDFTLGAGVVRNAPTTLASAICSHQFTQFQPNSAVQPLRAAATDTAFASLIDGDTVSRYAADASGKQSWGSGAATRDVTLERAAADVLALGAGDGLQMAEAAADLAAPAANGARIYTKDVAGKTGLFVRFATGAVQQIAIEP